MPPKHMITPLETASPIADGLVVSLRSSIFVRGINPIGAEVTGDLLGMACRESCEDLCRNIV